MFYQKDIQEFNKKRQHIVFKQAEHKESANAYLFNELVQNICPKNYNVFREERQRQADKVIFYDLSIGLKAGLRVAVLENKGFQYSLSQALEQKRQAQYDMTNILFQNMQEVLLLQENQIIDTASMDDIDKFDALLYQWLSFKNDTIEHFEKEQENFKKIVPSIAQQLQQTIQEQLEHNTKFQNSFADFYQLIQDSLGQTVSPQACEDMLIQHKMTIHLFKTIFQDTTFLSKNPIARSLDDLSQHLAYGVTANIEQNLNGYFEKIQQATAKVHDRHYQMEVLRAFYETFYQAYNPKAADTMGIVYTPVEVVDFMVQASDFLLKKHFRKGLASKGVHILDPCCGTGSFLAGIINFLPTGDLQHKYEHEIHANEMSIMAYYIANLYIEKLYFDKINDYSLFDSFKNMCLVDTLDNLDNEAIRLSSAGSNIEMFTSVVNAENTQRIQAQNKHKILVQIGNPPYNANQKNQNDNNPNKAYAHIDKRIRETYVKESSSQKTKVYDMYTRFIRWATDRIGTETNNEGMIAFITNRSFLEARGFDGFRKSVEQELTHIYTFDLGGDIRKNPKLSGPKHNVFAIQTGVCMTFFIKAPKSPVAQQIFYANPFEWNTTKMEKLNYLKHCTENYQAMEQIPWQSIIPDEEGNWLNQSTSHFKTLPWELINKEVKSIPFSQFQIQEHSTLFHLYSLGVVTARDSWVYDKDEANLKKKINYFYDRYHQDNTNMEKEKNLDDWKANHQLVSYNHDQHPCIKWTRKLYKTLINDKKVVYNENMFISSLYRPFIKRFLYYKWELNEEQYQLNQIFPTQTPDENWVIAINIGNNHFTALMSNRIVDFATLVFGGGSTQCIPLYQYTQWNEETQSFQKESNLNMKLVQQAGLQASCEEVFFYVYALLHHPLYREQYGKDLEQNFPRIPILTKDFDTLAQLGEKLGRLHMFFEQAEAFKMERSENEQPKPYPKTKLRVDKTKGEIILDENTTLKGLPIKALDYKLGNRSAIEWVLEGYKEKKIAQADGDIANEQSPLYKEYGYQPYQFKDYKKQCIGTLERVITVSLETQQIIDKIKMIPLFN